MITPINTDWFKDANWNSTISPQLAAAQTNYNSAASSLSSYEATYTAAKVALVNGSTNLATLQTLRSNFNTAQTQYNNLVSNLKTAALALLSAQSAAQTSIDTQGDANFNNYTTQLASVVPLTLTLENGVVSSSVPLSAANTTRNNAQTAFIAALNNFSSAENALITGRTMLQSLQDQLILANGDVAIAQLYLDSLPSGDPGIPAAQAALTSAQNAQTSLQTQVTAQQIVVNTLTTTRNSTKTALDTSLTTYTNAIDAQVSVLQLAYSNASSASTNFIADLQAARAQALALSQSSLSSSSANDTAQQTSHFGLYPTDNPQVISEIQAVQDLAIAQSTATFGAGLDNVSLVTSDITFPALPTSGSMSVRDLMRFISAIELLIGRLATELQQADKHIDEMRLKIWNYQSNLLATTTAILQKWAFTLELADNDYNVDAAKTNVQKSKDLVLEINRILSQAANINSIINQINSEIDDQNDRGDVVTTALNNANFIATDVVNEAKNTSPSIYNTGDILNQDPAVSYPTPRSDQPLLSDPADIPHLDPFVPPATSIPSSFPLDYSSSNDPNPRNIPDANTPSQGDIDQLNSIVDNLNLQLYPIKERLSNPPINYTFIEPFFSRKYIEVRDISIFLSLTNTSLITQLLANLVKAISKGRDYDVFNTDVLPFEGFTTFVEREIKPTTENQAPESGASIGSGTAISSADISGSQGKVARALTNVLSSGAFASAIQSLSEQSSLIGGLSSLTKLPTQIDNYSQLGLVRHDQLEETGTAVNNKVAATQAAAIAAAVQGTIEALVGTTGNSALLKQVALTQIAKLPPGSLNEDEIKELLASLVFLLQVLLLLVAALLDAAAQGETSIDKLVAKVFEKPEDEKIKLVIRDLKALQVALPTNITPSTPRFEEELINALFPLLPPEPQARFEEKIRDIFEDRGVSFTPKVTTQTTTTTEPLSVTDKPSFKPPIPLGTAIQNALNEVSVDKRPDIREDIREVLSSALDELRYEILIDATRKPTFKERIAEEVRLNQLPEEKVSTTPTASFTAPVSTATPVIPISTTSTTFTPLIPETAARQPGGTTPQTTTNAPPISLPPEVENAIITELNKRLPEIQGLSNDDRNALLIAFNTGAITSDQVSKLVNRFLREEALVERPSIADLIVPHGTPVTSGVHGETRSVSTRPKDTLALFREAFEKLSRQSDDDRLTHEVALTLADKVRDQTDFFARSLDLLMDPAKSMIKNFSIFTAESGPRDQQGPLSIPISG